uniref:Uncharacterized protein n=1 Tax=Arundo donax TaxID=35708 RepID=A0A0A8XPT9_ARUDO
MLREMELVDGDGDFIWEEDNGMDVEAMVVYDEEDRQEEVDRPKDEATTEQILLPDDIMPSMEEIKLNDPDKENPERSREKDENPGAGETQKTEKGENVGTKEKKNKEKPEKSGAQFNLIEEAQGTLKMEEQFWRRLKGEESSRIWKTTML